MNTKSIFLSVFLMIGILGTSGAPITYHAFAEDEVIATEETPVVEQPLVEEDTVVCDVTNTPIISTVGDYFEFPYGTSYLEVSSYVFFSVTDPGGNVGPITQNNIFNLFGGLNLFPGTHTATKVVTDVDGCSSMRTIEILIGQPEGFVCDATNSPEIHVPTTFLHYPSGTPRLVIDSDIEGMYITDPDSDPSYVTHTVDFPEMNFSAVADGVYYLTYNARDEWNCTDSKTVVIVVGPIPQEHCDANNLSPVISVANNSIEALINMNYSDLQTRFGEITLTDPNSLPENIVVTSNFSSEMTASSGTKTLTLTATNELSCTDTVDIEVIVANPPSGGGSGGGSGNPENPVTPTTPTTGGEVLGEQTTGEVLGATSCTPYLTTYLRYGRNNNVEEVKKLQTFLNEKMGANLPVTGQFKSQTLSWVKKFQEKEAEKILNPWKIKKATGIVYLTTTDTINMMMCPELALPTRTELLPWNKLVLN